jgi:hypothetical protein
MKVNKPIPKLTRENLGRIMNEYPNKHELGFTLWEVRDLLKPNSIEESQFRIGMFGQTYALIENKVVFYYTDVYNILKKLI